MVDYEGGTERVISDREYYTNLELIREVERHNLDVNHGSLTSHKKSLLRKFMDEPGICREGQFVPLGAAKPLEIHEQALALYEVALEENKMYRQNLKQ